MPEEGIDSDHVSKMRFLDRSSKECIIEEGEAHVARPPFDPRCHPISPFAGHIEEGRRSEDDPNYLSKSQQENVYSPVSPCSQPISIQTQSSLPLFQADNRQQNTSSLSTVLARRGSLMLPSSSSSSHPSLREQMSSYLREESCLSGDVGSWREDGRLVWGWLQATDKKMPNALLLGEGLAIGSSRQRFEAQRQAARLVLSAAGARQDASPSVRLAEVNAQALRFLEVPDGRISRLHCIVQPAQSLDIPWLSVNSPPASVEDISTNGTFLNGERLVKGVRTPLKDGDKLSLVLSLSPMVEKSFIFNFGDPGYIDLTWATTIPGKSKRPTNSPKSHQDPIIEDEDDVLDGGPIVRTKTSLYVTWDKGSENDTICQICLGPYRNCLAIQPCGHSFCAACLSHHFASLLQVPGQSDSSITVHPTLITITLHSYETSNLEAQTMQNQGGLPLSCPLRCAAPHYVVINHAMRLFVDSHYTKRTKSSSDPLSQFARGDYFAEHVNMYCPCKQFAVEVKPDFSTERQLSRIRCIPQVIGVD